MKHIRNVKILRLFGINGIVLWPFVFYADREPSERVRNHESFHVHQIREVGVLGFYFRYLKEYFHGRLAGMNHDEAYRNISFEREAYQNQDDFLYLASRSDARTSPRNSRSREPS